MNLLTSERLTIKSWATDLDPGTVSQAKNIANLPFAYHHIALIADAHLGYGIPIGGVLATVGAVVPNAVGVDIGCGMRAMKFRSSKDVSNCSFAKECLLKIIGLIIENIPVGMHHREKPLVWNHDIDLSKTPVLAENLTAASYQLGTLGGGNHFIEIQRGTDNTTWVMIHSGSRNVGLKVANHYNKLAIELNKRYFSSVPTAWDLAFLPQNTHEFSLYMAEMSACLNFAKANRAAMMSIIKDILASELGSEFEPEIDVHHNFAAFENHFEKNVVLHRKGATQAYAGEIGLIPGSQGTSSYIVRGLGNPESFMSCSHGAGRKMGRNDARKSLSLKEEINNLEASGVIHSIRTEKDLDEAPGAYKDIDEVMRNQEDLVSKVLELKPLAVIKG